MTDREVMILETAKRNCLLRLEVIQQIADENLSVAKLEEKISKLAGKKYKTLSGMMTRDNKISYLQDLLSIIEER